MMSETTLTFCVNCGEDMEPVDDGWAHSGDGCDDPEPADTAFKAWWEAGHALRLLGRAIKERVRPVLDWLERRLSRG